MNPFRSKPHLEAHESDQTLSPNDIEQQPLHPSSATLPYARPSHNLIKLHAIDEESTNPKRLWAQGIRLAAKTNAVILLVIVVLTITGACYGHQYGQGFVSMYEGDCKKTKTLATGLHIMINILGTALVATSSYCCQVLMAPTRENVDYAHAHRIWLPIGTFDLKQLNLLPWRRKSVWYLLFLTSIAIQLVFNSAVFSSTNANDYSVIMVPSSFALNDSLSFDSFIEPPDTFESLLGYNLSGIHASIRDEARFENLSIKQFTKEYTISTISSRRNLVCLSDQMERETEKLNATESIYWAGSGFPVGTSKIIIDDPFYWMRNALEQDTNLAQNYVQITGSSSFPLLTKPWPEENATSKDWPPYVPATPKRNITVQSCLSEKTEEKCKLLLNVPICAIVIFCNLLKLACMILAAREDRYEVLITIGDAIASFLQRPDPTTAYDCMADTSTMQLWGPEEYIWKSHSKKTRWKSTRQLPPPMRPGKPRTTSQRLIRAPNACTIAMGYFVTLLSMLIVVMLIFHKDSKRSGFGVGLGEINSVTLMTSLSLSFTPTILYVNCIHLLVTGLYFLYNDVVTRMLLALEYNCYALERKPLRVSFPQGKQRSTFYLTIPYRYGIPILATFTVIHWLTSEGFYFVQVMPHNIRGEEVPDRLMNTCGYSPGALVAAVSLMIILAILIFGISNRRFKARNMPLAMNCSATISAACHRPSHDIDAAFKPVMWGEVDMRGMDAFGDISLSSSYRHCSFTSEPVAPPTKDVLYV